MASTHSLPSKAQEHVTADAVTLLKGSHRTVQELFKRYETAGSGTEKRRLVRQICIELILRTKLEEEISYSACREKSAHDDLLDEAQVETDSAKVLIRLEPTPPAHAGSGV